MAIDKGYLDSVKHRVLDLFSELVVQNRDLRKEAMTVQDLLTMRSGLDYEESNQIINRLSTSRDWVKFMLDTPMKEQPGTLFNYCSGCSHILSAIVQKVGPQ